MSAEHRKAARLAIENARELAEDARILLEGGRPARALSLSVIGSEEAGKALLHSFAALNLAANVVTAFTARKGSTPLVNHLFKQLAVEMIGGADSQLDSYEMAAAGELPPYSPHERTSRLVCGCAATLSTMFSDRNGVAAGRAWFDGIKKMLPGRKYFREYESPDEEKMRGLYVDLGRPSGQPQDVTRLDARSSLLTLTSTLEVLAHLESCLQDDELWEELCGEVDNVREDYT